MYVIIFKRKHNLPLIMFKLLKVFSITFIIVSSFNASWTNLRLSFDVISYSRQYKSVRSNSFRKESMYCLHLVLTLTLEYDRLNLSKCPYKYLYKFSLSSYNEFVNIKFFNPRYFGIIFFRISLFSESKYNCLEEDINIQMMLC